MRKLAKPENVFATIKGRGWIPAAVIDKVSNSLALKPKLTSATAPSPASAAA